MTDEARGSEQENMDDILSTLGTRYVLCKLHVVGNHNTHFSGRQHE